MKLSLFKLDELRDRIAECAGRAGRERADVKFVAVTKYEPVGSGFIPSLLEQGLCDFGEARPQILLEKATFYAERFPETPIRWHLIGSMQRNKIRSVLAHCSLIHSIDSLRLLEAVDRIAKEEKIAEPARVLLEFNISGDASKHGFSPDSCDRLWDEIAPLEHVRVLGLMGMSGLDSDADQKRREFATLRQLLETYRNQVPENVSLEELSMGMSDDFEIAVEEGATLLRIGSMLYEPE